MKSEQLLKFEHYRMAGKVIDGVCVSNYVLQILNSEALCRYNEKCKEISNVDPYNIPLHRFKDITTLLAGDLPDLRHSDIYQYLIRFKSAFNHNELRAYRSLDSYKYFIAEWVSELLVADIVQGKGSTVSIVTAKVRYLKKVYTCTD